VYAYLHAGYVYTVYTVTNSMYGDHLYKKGDYDGAIQQYQHTIGHLEPSYVIRRYLEAQRISHLTQYLETLHSEGAASADHTTLLLNCYTKLKDVTKLDSFILGTAKTTSSSSTTISISTAGSVTGSVRGSVPETSAQTSSLQFDVETALRVLKSAGYSDHAAALAQSRGYHDWYLRIQLERPHPNYADALRYISGLPAGSAEKFLQRYGKVLVSALPEDTTGLLMAMCTGKYRPSITTATTATTNNTASSNGASSPQQHSPTADGTTVGTTVANGQRGSLSGTAMPPRSKPEDFIHLYVDHSKWLRVFLQYMVRGDSASGGSSSGSSRASGVVSDTLLELLLREWAQSNAQIQTLSPGSGKHGKHFIYLHFPLLLYAASNLVSHASMVL
jgi:vacuolar protein sorting-associated protein 11